MQDIAHHRQVQPPCDKGKNERAKCAHRGGLCRGGDAANDGAQDGKDQGQRRNDHLADFDQKLLRSECVAFFLGDGGHHVGFENTEQHQIKGQHPGQNQSGHHGRSKQRSDGLPQNIGKQDQNKAGRDDLAQRARCANHATGNALVIAAIDQGL